MEEKMSENLEAAKNIQMLEIMYARLTSGDLAGFLEGLSDDVISHQSPLLPYGGVYKGKQAIATMLAERILPLLDGSKTKMIAPLMAADDRVISSWTVQAHRTGEVLRLLEHATIKNGKVVELRVFYFDPSLM
jgi:ketosteroid isomerase-like protein